MRLLSLSILVLVAAQFANAQSGGWQFAQETDSVLQVAACRVFIGTGGENSVELSVTYPSDGQTLPMIRVQTTTKADAIEISTAGLQDSFRLNSMQVTSEGAQIYWYAPKNFPQLEQLLRVQSTLSLKFVGAETSTVSLSLPGADPALVQAAACLQNPTALTTFWQDLNLKPKNPVEPAGNATTLFAFQATQKAYEDDLSLQQAQARLTPLQQPILGYLASEAQGRKALIKAQRQFNQAQAALAAEKDPAQLPALQAASDQAGKNLEKMKEGMGLLEDILRDYHQQADPWQAQFNTASADLDVQRAIFQAFASGSAE